MKKRIIKINNLKEVKENKEVIYNYKEYNFELYRVKNDINGNPLYRFTLESNGISKHDCLKGLVYRNYLMSNYALIQSYDINNSLDRIFTTLEK